MKCAVGWPRRERPLEGGREGAHALEVGRLGVVGRAVRGEQGAQGVGASARPSPGRIGSDGRPSDAGRPLAWTLQADARAEGCRCGLDSERLLRWRVALLAVGCGGEDGDGDSESSTLSAAESTDEPRAPRSVAGADTTPPTVKARAAKAAVGEPLALRFSVTDDSGSTRENITIWKGQKRRQLITGQTFEATPEAGDERTTTLDPADLGAWKTKPGKYRWCVRAIDEAGNKSKVGCAVLTVTAAGAGGQESTAEEPATSAEGTTSSEDEASTDDGGTSDDASSEDDASSTG